MATQMLWKVVLFSNTVLPDIYTSYAAANEALQTLCESSTATFGRVVRYDDESGKIIG